MNPNKHHIAKNAAIRCAIYTRKSTEEGLEQEFNSLDAQRESAEACIRSQQHEGWTCVSARYDDGGFTGGNMDRPALRRLMADVEAGKIDCVVVYKVDRLSRSLLDFGRIMETFEKSRISFVSVTQQFNTTTSMGRLMLNVLLSFAQFEREIISERTRDKIAATRRKGKWSGGLPVLGYDVDAKNTRLLVNADEAIRVRAIFQMYLDHQSLLPVIQELEKRGWVNKRWVTRKGRLRGGEPFTKTSLHRLLTNIIYGGKIRHKEEIHAGEHAAIIDPGLWQRVQTLLRRNGSGGGAQVRNRFGALLKGLLKCKACDCAMVPSHSTKNKIKRYRYYVCSNAQKRGWDHCPSKSLPAEQIEQFVVEQIRGIGKDSALLAATIAEASRQEQARTRESEAEQRQLEHDMAHWNAEMRKVVEQAALKENSPATAHLADLQERIRHTELRLPEVKEQLKALDRGMPNEHEVATALADFDPWWQTLAPRERTRLVELLIQRVDYDAVNGKVAIAFHATGLQSLSKELLQRQEKIA